jgi:hypothetical protein
MSANLKQLKFCRHLVPVLLVALASFLLLI